MKLETPILFLATDDAEASKAFYEGALGLTLAADEPYALVFKSGVITLRIQKLDSFQPVPYTVLGWEVDEIYSAVEALEATSVTFERFPNMPQDDRGVWRSPSGARIAWFRDPVGNLLSLTQMG